MFPPSIGYRFPKCIRMHHLSSHIGETEDEAMRGGGLALVHVFPSFPTESGD